jgi:hypothetical protein
MQIFAVTGARLAGVADGLRATGADMTGSSIERRIATTS